MNIPRERTYAKHEMNLNLNREYRAPALYNAPDTATGLIMATFLSLPLMLGSFICYESIHHRPAAKDPLRLERPLNVQNSIGMNYYSNSLSIK